MVEALLTLYSWASGPRWVRSDNWLTGEPCEDDWYGVTCCPVSYPRLISANANSTSSTWGGAAGWCVPANSSNSALAPSAGRDPMRCKARSYTGERGYALDESRCVVVALRLPDNNLTGVLNESLAAELSHLQVLDLSGNSLKGQLPASVALLSPPGDFSFLRLAENNFDYSDSSGQISDVVQLLVQRCKLGSTEGGIGQCEGLPPTSCTSFDAYDGSIYTVSSSAPDTCVKCRARRPVAIIDRAPGGGAHLAGGVRCEAYRHPRRALRRSRSRRQEWQVSLVRLSGNFFVCMCVVLWGREGPGGQGGGGWRTVGFVQTGR